MCQKYCVWGLFLQHASNEKYQNPALPHKLHHTVHEPRFCYIDANAAALLQFLLLIQTRLFVVQVKPTIFLEMSPIELQFREVFSPDSVSFLTYSLVLSCIERNLLLETFALVNVIHVWRQSVSKHSSEFTTGSVVPILISTCIGDTLDTHFGSPQQIDACGVTKLSSIGCMWACLTAYILCH